ncbi:hypothetical protein [Roseisolibacter sp. H3M3-2]|uniref:hypothetical protein n=1 Tax=Roseisolibacter sp. H3M3-2 TaxID=3031323 RepID=UPI0023DCC1DE|nr:hypothetical protein [Roseisolibacter sp. H3M3-2]MDF1502219.1 hypothetical protein [Roseisolibacter sp. H3M3-2]
MSAVLRSVVLPALLLATACAHAPRSPLAAPVPALRRALADPDSARRVYSAGEVARSATLAGRARPVSSREDGEVRARIVVGVDGKVVPGLLEFLPESDPELAERLLAVLPQWRFRPAERVGRVPVRQLVLVTVRSKDRHTSVDLQPAARPEG